MSIDAFRPALIAAAAAGILAALVLTLLQSLWITPLILRAETFEDSAPALSGHTHDAADHHDHEALAHHHHDEQAWKPEDGWQRTLFTLAANIVMGFGYALLLAGVFLMRKRPASLAQGLWLGLAGFIVFFAAPGLGLPPELPGTAAADLGERQQWWLATAATTALGIALLCARIPGWARALGALFLVAPHIVGAPHPALPASAAPASLQTEFRIATTLGNAVFWLLLGVICARLLRRQPR